MKRYQLLLNSIATADMNYNQLDAFLKSQMQKREVSRASYVTSPTQCSTLQGALSATEAATITKFWQTQKSKV